MVYTIGEGTSKLGQASKMELFQKKKLTALGHYMFEWVLNAPLVGVQKRYYAI